MGNNSNIFLVNFKNSNGDTALSLARKHRKYTGIIEHLKKAGAKE